MDRLPPRLYSALLETMLVSVMRAPLNAEQAANLPPGWSVCWCADCFASLITDPDARPTSLAELEDVAPLIHAAGCPWAWLEGRK